MPDNPYPGAKPLASEHPSLLLGRDDLLSEVANLMRRHTVVEIAGPSGVGKSSLIGAGFCGRLNVESGLLIRTFSAWSDVPNASGVVWYAHVLDRALRSASGHEADGAPSAGQERIERALQSAPDLEQDPVAFVDAVQRQLGTDTVVVFDQLEELLRDDPQLGRTFLANVRDVALGYPDGFTQVVSLREEYLSHLKLIEEHLEPSLWTLKLVGELDSRFTRDLVTVPLAMTASHVSAAGDRIGAVKAERDLIDVIEGTWKLARPDLDQEDNDTSLDEGRTGLLHLQAFLYSMWEELQPTHGQVLTSADVATVMDLTWPNTEADAGRFFVRSLASILGPYT